MTHHLTRRRMILASAAALAPLGARAQAQPAWAGTAARLDQLHALVVNRGGAQAFGRAFRGPALDRPVNVKSVSKTIVALLTGIAIDRGVLDGPDQPVLPILGRAAIRQPAMQAPTIRAICSGSVSPARAPGGTDRSIPQTADMTRGATVTITRTREAWISDSARTSPPASSPNTSMSCSPPGIAPNHAVAWSKPNTRRNSGYPAAPISSTNSGTKASDSAKSGRCPTMSGVIADPAATPRNVRMNVPSSPRSRIRAPAKAPARQAAIGPSRNGSGSPAR